MRRSIGLCLTVMFLAACGEMEDSSPLGVPPDEGPIATTASQIQIEDGAPGTGVGNPYFFFLPPVADETPETGTSDGDLEPIVTLCHAPFGSDTCFDDEDPITFTLEPNTEGNSISVSDVGVYSVVWKTNDYPVEDLGVYKIAVSLVLPSAVMSSDGSATQEIDLGQALVRAYDNQTYSSFQHTDDFGYIAISDNGNLNIKFIIEEGLLESELCGANQVEDCDVALFYPEEAGCLDVYENPDQDGQLPGSRVCVPENAIPMVGSTEVQGVYAVILTLELPGAAGQGANFPSDHQYELPYFPDVATVPQGISFDSNGEGVQITICQRESEFESEDLLHEARPYLVYSNGITTQTVVLKPAADGTPQEGEYVFDPTACLDEEPLVGAAASPSGSEGFLGYLAAGVSRVTNLFRPRPLVARRLHGGLNTTVYNTSPPGAEDNVAAFAEVGSVSLEGEEYAIGAGAVLDANIDHSGVAVEPEDGLMLETATITVTPRNARDEIIPFDVTVTVWVEGDNAVEPFEATDPDGDGIYEATYTPEEPGTDYIHVAIDGVEFPEAFEYEVAPLSGLIEVHVEIEPSSIPESEPTDPAVGLPVNLYDADGALLETTTTQATGTWGEGVATFGSEAAGTYLFGDYAVALPKRDFDFIFEEDSNGDEIYEQDVTHNADPTIVTFSGSLMDLPDGMHVYRVGAGSEGANLYPADPFGTGNVYQYVEDTRSWVSAQNQIRDLTLGDAYRNVPAHLVTIRTAGENGFAASLVMAQCSPETDAKKCKSRGWIGLTDEETDGSFEWVDDGEGQPKYLNPCDPSDPLPDDPFFFGWMYDNRRGEYAEPSGKNNEDQVEINLDGEWFDENGASSTNDGYIIEFKAWQPQEDPPLTCSGG